MQETVFGRGRARHSTCGPAPHLPCRMICGVSRQFQECLAMVPDDSWINPGSTITVIKFQTVIRTLVEKSLWLTRELPQIAPEPPIDHQQLSSEILTQVNFWLLSPPRNSEKRSMWFRGCLQHVCFPRNSFSNSEKIK